MTRTFVAIWIPEEWSAYLAGVTQSLADEFPGLSWVKAGNVHLTVRFLGNLEDADVRRACVSLRRSAEGQSAPLARLGGLGAFPRLERPRILWIGLAEGREAIESLAGAINNGLDQDGFGPPEKPFQAHLTLARVREGARLLGLKKTRLPDPPPAAPLERVAVMKSDLHPTGARYNVLEEIRLRRFA